MLNVLEEPISKYTNPKMETIDYALTVEDAAKQMEKSEVDSILVYTLYKYSI